MLVLLHKIATSRRDRTSVCAGCRANGCPHRLRTAQHRAGTLLPNPRREQIHSSALRSTSRPRSSSVQAMVRSLLTHSPGLSSNMCLLQGTCTCVSALVQSRRAWLTHSGFVMQSLNRHICNMQCMPCASLRQILWAGSTVVMPLERAKPLPIPPPSCFCPSALCFTDRLSHPIPDAHACDQYYCPSSPHMACCHCLFAWCTDESAALFV